MQNIIVILLDQLSHDISSLKFCNKKKDLIVIIEDIQQIKNVKHHKKKLVLLISAARHFVKELEKKQYNVKHIKLTDQNQNFFTKLETIVNDTKSSTLYITEPSEYEFLKKLEDFQKKTQAEIKILEDNRFLCSIKEFQNWAQNQKKLLMENFYRSMRIKHSILINNGKPECGQWNFDHENRAPPKRGDKIPDPIMFEPNNITKEVIKIIDKVFNDNFGETKNFNFAVTRTEALKVLSKFIKERLKYFGKYQDAMIENEPYMYHSHISFYLNIGLLSPLECIKAVENEYYNKKIPINAAEGFIRQIIGWREYIRGIYWKYMPEYANENYFNAKNNLPNFFWDHNTKMNCIKQCVLETKQNAYAHHIQRLMVLGNFFLAAGIDPKYVNEWYLIVYADAYEWVTMPNVTGMILFADGGKMSSKPYAASGAYIKKMSNYCDKCHYNVNEKNGDTACPFNYLYWNFLNKNRNQLENNHRMKMMYRLYDKMTPEKKEAIKNDSKKFINQILKT